MDIFEWDLTRLIEEVLTGLSDLAREFPQVKSIGIDIWAVDYGLLDSDLNLLAEPISYRDDRSTSEVAGVHSRVSAKELYDVNGLQHLPFTTLFQLAAEKRSSLWDKAARRRVRGDCGAVRVVRRVGAAPARRGCLAGWRRHARGARRDGR